MRLTIVRHAYAGHKKHWDGPDLERPLDELGRRQALALAAALGRGRRVSRVVSSPAVRCLQTVTPLSDATGVPVEVWDDLGPEGFARRIISACFGDAHFDDAVLCTHGELLQPLLERHDIRRLARHNNLHREELLTKGSAWRLHIEPDGRATRLTHLVPRTT
jgi:8-oxo-dGTP diphosphatase